jgi:hypothetical protein
MSIPVKLKQKELIKKFNTLTYIKVEQNYFSFELKPKNSIIAPISLGRIAH